MPDRIVIVEGHNGNDQVQDKVNQELANLTPNERYELTFIQKEVNTCLTTTVFITITQLPATTDNPDIQDTV